MGLSIAQQFNLEYPELFSPLIDGRNRLINSGLFLKGVEKFVGRDKVISARVLRGISLGRVDIFKQERIFSWIDSLHYLAKKNAQDDLSLRFFEAMEKLVDKTDARFKRRGYEDYLDKDAVSEYFGFGGNAAVISYGVRVARYLANREAYKHFGYKYSQNHPSHTVDFPARIKIQISNPKYEDFAEDFEGNYEGGAKIKRIEENLWELCFKEYYLSTYHEYLWNLNLWIKIFQAIKPILTDIFEADVTYVRENQFND